MFKLWSETNMEARNVLKPDLGLRSWSILTKEDKFIIWRHLDTHFFDINERGHDGSDYTHTYTNKNGMFYKFYTPDSNLKRIRITKSIATINNLYKAKNYAKKFLQDNSHFSACEDFYFIFCQEEGDVVLELISIYCMALIEESSDEFYFARTPEQSIKKYEEEKLKWKYAKLEEFAKDLNEVFGDFGLNVYLTKNGFIPRQDDKINKNIFEPVLQFLADTKWKNVNNLLADAFTKYRENTPNSYSSCVTHTVAAVEAFLQIIVKGKTGEGDFAALISEGQRKGLIPSDVFTKEMFKNIISLLMRERKETGDAHVKQAYATERNAKMVLNLSMILLQHCIVN